MTTDWDQGWSHWVRGYARGFRFSKDAAQSMGIAESMLSRWLDGRRPSCESVIAVARKLGISEHDLLRMAGYLSAESVLGPLPAPKQRLMLLLRQPDIEIDEERGEGMVRALIEEMRRKPS